MLRFIFGYICWHYSRGVKELARHVKNFVWFFWNFFSIGILFKTFFLPWKGLGERYKPGIILNPGDALGTFFVNGMMRIVGIFARIILIAVGFAFILVAYAIGLLAIIGWILYPLVLGIFLIAGLRFIFT